MKTVGVIGGIGPRSTFLFGEMVVNLRHATTDQDNIPMIIMNDTSIPDRTAFILDNTLPNPVPRLIHNIKLLNTLGVDMITIICNTAYAFIDELQAETSAPILNMPLHTIEKLVTEGIRKAGIASTAGSRKVGLYEKYAWDYGLDLISVDDQLQEVLMHIIYGKIKAGKPTNSTDLRPVTEFLFDHGCEKIIMGCTELSVYKRDHQLSNQYFTDPIEVLASVIIEKASDH